MSTPHPSWNPGGRQPRRNPQQHPGRAARWDNPPTPAYPNNAARQSYPSSPQWSAQHVAGPAVSPHGRPPRRKGLWITAAVAVTVAAALVVFAVTGEPFSSSQSTDRATQVASSSTAPPATPQTPTQGPISEPENHCEGATPSAGPHTPSGWRHVVSARGLVYDVPPEWVVESCGTLIGWESADCPDAACPTRMMSGAATAPPEGKCVLALSGVPGARDINDIHEAIEAESRSVSGIYTTEDGIAPKVALSSPRDLTIDGRPAVEVIASVTERGQGVCGSHDATHTMIATTVEGQPGTVLFLLAVYYDGAAPTAMIDQMVGSLRLAPM